MVLKESTPLQSCPTHPLPLHSPGKARLSAGRGGTPQGHAHLPCPCHPCRSPWWDRTPREPPHTWASSARTCQHMQTCRSLGHCNIKTATLTQHTTTSRKRDTSDHLNSTSPKEAMVLQEAYLPVTSRFSVHTVKLTVQRLQDTSRNHLHHRHCRSCHRHLCHHNHQH